MKISQTRSLLIVFLCLSSWLVYGQPIQEVPHVLKEVIVFRNTAQLFHEGSTSLGKGKHVLHFKGIATQVDAATLQCTGKGNGMIQSVSVEQNFLQEGTGIKDKLKPLRDSITAHKFSLSIVDDKLDVLAKEEGLLMANQRLGGEESSIKVEELIKAAQFFRTRLEEIRTQQRNLNQQKAILSERLKRFEDQLRSEQSQSGQPSMDVVIVFLAETEGKFQFTFDYTAYGAQWTPLYDLRVQGGKSEVQLQMKASIAQQTGLDWSKVQLTLSSRNPTKGGQAPELYPWRLDFRRIEPPVTMQRSMRKSKNAPAAAYAGAPAMEDAEEVMMDMMSSSDLTTVSENALALEYNLAGNHTIYSGPKAEILDVARYTLPASYQYLIIPRLSTQAYLMAKVTGWEPYNLSQGQMSIFLDGSFTGRAFLNPNQATDTLEFSLGVDPAVVVKREPIQVFNATKTLGSQRRVSRGFRITVKNGRSSPIMVHVVEQIPLSSNSQISVSLTKTDDGNYEAERGELHWRSSLAPAASLSREVSYEVKYPKDQIIDGL